MYIFMVEVSNNIYCGGTISRPMCKKCINIQFSCMIFTFPFNSVQLLVVRVVCHGSYISLNTCVREWEQASKDTPGTHVNVYSTWTDKVTECWRYTKRRQVDRWADRWRMKDERWQKIATKLGFFPNDTCQPIYSVTWPMGHTRSGRCFPLFSSSQHDVTHNIQTNKQSMTSWYKS